MLHRAVTSTTERFVSYLLEENKGLFPLWIAPVQFRILPVNNEFHLEYSKNLNNIMTDADLRTELDDRNEKLSYKVRDSQMNKIPYTIIIGDKEVKDKLISYRKYGSEETFTTKIDDFFDMIKEKIKTKK